MSAVGTKPETIDGGKAAQHQPSYFPEKNGAGEAIRTLDPNLGKVVLYP